MLSYIRIPTQAPSETVTEALQELYSDEIASGGHWGVYLHPLESQSDEESSEEEGDTRDFAFSKYSIGYDLKRLNKLKTLQYKDKTLLINTVRNSVYFMHPYNAPSVDITDKKIRIISDSVYDPFYTTKLFYRLEDDGIPLINFNLTFIKPYEKLILGYSSIDLRDYEDLKGLKDILLEYNNYKDNVYLLGADLKDKILYLTFIDGSEEALQEDRIISTTEDIERLIEKQYKD